MHEDVIYVIMCSVENKGRVLIVCLLLAALVKISIEM